MFLKSFTFPILILIHSFDKQMLLFLPAGLDKFLVVQYNFNFLLELFSRPFETAH